MDLREYQQIIMDSDEEDWTHISCWGAGSGPSYLNKFVVWNTGAGEFNNFEVDSHSNIISLKSDLSISIAWGLTHNDDFVEEWANNFPDNHATSSFIDYFYNGQLIFRDISVIVDGGRCGIPLPKIIINNVTKKIDRYVVPEEKYIFFGLLNRIESLVDYEDYFKRTGIVITKDNWMY
jgi:hypothetical protein